MKSYNNHANRSATVQRPATPPNPSGENGDRPVEEVTSTSATSATTSNETEESTTVDNENMSMVAMAAQGYGSQLTQLSAQMVDKGEEMGLALATELFTQGLATGVLKGQTAAISHVMDNVLMAQNEGVKARLANFTPTTSLQEGCISQKPSMPSLSAHF